MSQPNCASNVWRFATEKKQSAFSVMCSSFGSMPGLIAPLRTPLSSTAAIWLMIGRVISLSFSAGADVPAAVDVLDRDQADVFRVGLVEIEGEFRKPADRSLRLQRLEVEVFLGNAHLGVRHLEDGDEQLFLRIEIIEDQPLGDVRARGDRVGVAASEAVLGELRERNLQDLALGPLPVAPSDRRFFRVRGRGFSRRFHLAVRSLASGNRRLPSIIAKSRAIDSNYPTD